MSNTKPKTEKIILGIDPGTIVMGYGLIKTTGEKIELIGLGSIHLSKLANQALKLQKIYERVTWLADEYKPDFCAVESPFFGKNPQSMLKLGRAQGVCMVAVLNRDIPVVEYSPKKIKQSVTGSGNASKEQVAAMLKTLCKFQNTPKYLDATDGLAAAVCHHFNMNVPQGTSNYNSWKDFAKNNPKKVSS